MIRPHYINRLELKTAINFGKLVDLLTKEVTLTDPEFVFIQRREENISTFNWLKQYV